MVQVRESAAAGFLNHDWLLFFPVFPRFSAAICCAGWWLRSEARCRNTTQGFLPGRRAQLPRSRSRRVPLQGMASCGSMVFPGRKAGSDCAASGSLTSLSARFRCVRVFFEVLDKQ